MDTEVLTRLFRAYCYAVAPYICLFLAVAGSRGSFGSRLAAGLAAANAGFILLATLTAHVSTAAYQTMHPAIALLAVLALIYRWRQANWYIPPLKLEGPAVTTTTIVLLAFAVRLLPILLGGESLGGGDARFHNILARKIMLTGRLARDWQPFAGVGVMYPQGIHVLTVFLATAARCSVHEAFNFMFPVVGAITTALIYLAARVLFDSHRSAAWAAVCYSFLAVWGSLDLYRWGGLPNAMGMMLLCIVLLAILKQPTFRFAALVTALCIPAIALTHHYSLIVAAVMLTSIALFTADGKLRRFTMTVAGLGILFSGPLLAMHYFRFLGGIGSTGVLVFREPVRTALFYLLHMGPALVALFVCALILAPRNTWTAARLAVLAWFTGLFAAFVALEYLCRAGVLLATGGRDCFACLTPSRMVTNMAYPMSILCGAIPASRLWKKRRALLAGALAVLAVANSAMAVRDQADVGVFPEFTAAAKWLAGHTAQDAMIVGSMPHLEYQAWRETSNPPLPASEQRNHADLLQKREMDSLADWLAWEKDTGRRVYFIIPEGDAKPDGLNELYSNNRVSILSTQEKQEPVAEGLMRSRGGGTWHLPTN